MNCPVCNTTNPQAARFCQHCGGTLLVAPGQSRTVALPPPALTLREAPPCVPAPPVALGPTLASCGSIGTTMPCAAVPSPKFEQREHTFFLLDISVSMGEYFDETLNKLEAAKRGSMSMVFNKTRIDADDEIGLVAFNSSARIVLPLSCLRTQKRRILEAIQALTVQGGTDINRGLKTVRDAFEWHRTDVVRRIVLLTDGHGGDPLRTADYLKEQGVVIDVIGVGADSSGVDERLLREVASVIQGETRYRFIKDSQTLVDHYTDLADKTALA